MLQNYKKSWDKLTNTCEVGREHINIVASLAFQELSRMIDQAPDIVADPADDSDDEFKVKQKFLKYDVEASKLDSSGMYYKDSDSELEMESDSDTEKEKESLGKEITIIRKIMYLKKFSTLI